MTDEAQFKITRVTPRFHGLVKALESTVNTFADAGDDYPARTKAWTRISIAREALYEYVESLEKMNNKINKERTVQLRF